jgi:hypothetical protein
VKRDVKQAVKQAGKGRRSKRRKKEDPGGIGRRGEKGERRREGSIVGNFKVPGRLVVLTVHI